LCTVFATVERVQISSGEAIVSDQADALDHIIGARIADGIGHDARILRTIQGVVTVGWRDVADTVFGAGVHGAAVEVYAVLIRCALLLGISTAAGLQKADWRATVGRRSAGEARWAIVCCGACLHAEAHVRPEKLTLQPGWAVVRGGAGRTLPVALFDAALPVYRFETRGTCVHHTVWAIFGEDTFPGAVLEGAQAGKPAAPAVLVQAVYPILKEALVGRAVAVVVGAVADFVRRGWRTTIGEAIARALADSRTVFVPTGRRRTIVDRPVVAGAGARLRDTLLDGLARIRVEEG
jgi:hypothetical protein